MRAASSRRAGRRNDTERRTQNGPDAAGARGIDFAELADAVAKAHGVGRRFDDPAIAIPAVLAELLPSMRACFGFVTDLSGRPIASASGSSEGLSVAALERPRLLAAVQAVLGGEPAVIGGRTFASEAKRFAVEAARISSDSPKWLFMALLNSLDLESNRAGTI